MPETAFTAVLPLAVPAAPSESPPMTAGEDVCFSTFPAYAARSRFRGNCLFCVDLGPSKSHALLGVELGLQLLTCFLRRGLIDWTDFLSRGCRGIQQHVGAFDT